MAVEAGQYHTPFVGRDDHRQAYQQMLRAGDGPWMLLITGQSGNGKSCLLRQLQVETPASFQTRLLDFADDNLRIDVLCVAETVGYCLKPLVDASSFQMFRQEVQAGRKRLAEMQLSLRQEINIGAGAQAQGLFQSMNTGSAINEMRRQVERIVTDALMENARAARGRFLVLLLDTCEWFHEPGSQEVGIWLKDALTRLHEHLGGGLRVVAAGREGLEQLFPFEGTAHRPLHLLPRPELDVYLQQMGMQEAILRRAVFEMTRGHPLCASIVAQVWRTRPFASSDLPAFEGEFNDQAITRWVLEGILKRLPKPYDDLVRYGVLLRSFDLPLLRAVFPEWVDSGDERFQRLINYSFVIRLANRRYAFHDLLRQVQADYVRRQLPERWQEYHQRALLFWKQQRVQVVLGLEVQPADYYFHGLALDEQKTIEAWIRAVWGAFALGEKDHWNGLLQAAHDSALTPGKLLMAARAFHQGYYFLNEDQKDKALDHFQQALALYRQVGDRSGAVNTLQLIGEIQCLRGQYADALSSYQQALGLFRVVGDHLREANALQIIGGIQRILLQDKTVALSSYQQALALYRQVGDHSGEADSLLGIGKVLYSQKDIAATLSTYQQALGLYRDVGNRTGEANSLRAIGEVQQFQQKIDTALSNYQQALGLYHDVGNRLGEASTLKAIGDVHQTSGDLQLALHSYQEALTLFRKIDDRSGEANCYKECGNVLLHQKNFHQALSLQTQAYHVFELLEDHFNQAHTLVFRSCTHEAMGNWPLAIQDMEAAVQIAWHVQLPQLEAYRQMLAELRGARG